MWEVFTEMNKYINQLIKYALENHLINKNEVNYSVNLLLDIFHLNEFQEEEVASDSLYNILDHMLAYAINQNIIEDGITQKDLFDTRIMNALMPRPATVQQTFNMLYKQNPVDATNYFYDLAIKSNYIRKNRVDRNIKFTRKNQYGHIDITINLSKPEKDPKAIAAAKLIKKSSYPQCLLCKENVGFAGTLNHPARQTLRLIELNLSGDTYYMQYSPYVYYNEHCIILNKDHVPMKIDHHTFSHLLDFITIFPHYMLGSNADLPIVGGSILTHDHYQGGRYHFPMEDAKVIKSYTFDGVQVDMMYWPLSTLRLTSASKDKIVKLADKILLEWRNYSDEEVGILAKTDAPHNTITPIARRQGKLYQLDLVLRNNRTTEEYPLGIFHPHQEHHHIKKENIGLIEVMGLAILPARLKKELNEIKSCLLKQHQFDEFENLEKHRTWYNYLQTLNVDESNIDDVIENEVAKKFTAVLEDAGVFKMDENGIEHFMRFVESLEETYD